MFKSDIKHTKYKIAKSGNNEKFATITFGIPQQRFADKASPRDSEKKGRNAQSKNAVAI